MKSFLLGLLSIILVGVRILAIIPAYVIVTIAAQIERLQEWVDTKRGIPIAQVGGDDPESLIGAHLEAHRIAAEMEHVRLLKLVDLVWQTATDSKEVPSTAWAEELITRWRAGDPR